MGVGTPRAVTGRSAALREAADAVFGIALASHRNVTLVRSTDNADVGEVREEVEAEYNAEPLAIGFNPKYMVELLMQMTSDQITIALAGGPDERPPLLDPGPAAAPPSIALVPKVPAEIDHEAGRHVDVSLAG